MANSDEKSEQSATEKTTGKAKTDALQAELAELRAQLDALRARSGKDAQESPPSPGAGGQASETETEEEAAPDLSTQLQTLLQGLDKEFKESNPMTLVAVFGLGILVGRLLSR
jgi:ElaB/YqjD/DUF883 family membrane-anchored ribosome-binding protein